MKKVLAVLLVITALSLYACATEQGYNTQKGAAIGAIGGALAGQAIGGHTGSTLIGAAVGALAGAIAGNAVDQNEANKRVQQPVAPVAVAAPSPSPQDVPPGQWIQVPGQWVGGKWVPAHRAWVPVNP
jgi:outer membrane lipoprotein SlyB